MARILVIDDEKFVRTTVKKILENNGHEVTEAGTGSEGIEAYRSAPSDLIICDLIMPGTDGVAAIKELKKEFPKIRIIATSGGGRLGNLDFLKLATLHGADAALAKPYPPAELMELVQKLLPK